MSTSRFPSATRVAAGGRAACGERSGERSRERLGREALRFFAGKGHARTSTRAICIAAGAHAAALHDHVGNGAGPYRDVCLKPILHLLEGAIGPVARCHDPVGF